MGFIKTLMAFLIVFSTASALSYKDLYPYLVDIKGWQAEEPTGSKVTAVYGEMLTVERSYHRDDKRLDVSIIKSPMATSSFAVFSMVTEADTPEEYIKVFKINGLRAGLSHNKRENSGDIIVVLTGDSVFTVKYENMSYSEALEILKQFPLKEIAKRLLEL
ncbi:hypothetical protein [Persephonella sp.]|nr:hypothetical protein [Aquificota bacterium]